MFIIIGIINFPVDCPRGWIDFEESCYHLTREGLTWRDAAATCHRLGGHLVVLDGRKEADWLQVQLSILLLHDQGTCPAWWTAGISSDGTWIWDTLQSVYG